MANNVEFGNFVVRLEAGNELEELSAVGSERVVTKAQVRGGGQRVTECNVVFVATCLERESVRSRE